MRYENMFTASSKGKFMKGRKEWYRLIVLMILLVAGSTVFAQNPELANQYFRDREYEKAAGMYKKLYLSGKNSNYFFDRYVDCLVYLEDYDEAENEIKDRLKKIPENTKLYVRLGELYELQLQPEKANKQYELALKRMRANASEINQLATAFRNQTKYDMAIEAYERGMELLGDSTLFAYQLADLYSLKGETEPMIRYYLLSVEGRPNRSVNLKSLFQRKLQEDDFPELQAQLYQKIQQYPDEIQYPELLEWSFIQQKDYYNAFRQARSLDRRLGENGARVYNIGQIAMNADDYETAIEAFDYIVEREGINSSYYIAAKQMALEARRRQIYAGGKPNLEQLKKIESEYLAFLDEFGKTPRTAIVLSELATFEARYLNDVDQAIEYLSELIAIPGVNQYLIGNAKLDLGDLYLLKGDRWEATLLYSQVDKAFPEELLGEQARFRNAKLSYYVGDFEWAQEQFDILKSSTSKLIANDAIDLSVFIMDNVGLDTTAVPLEMYAQAELLEFQEQYGDAFAKLEELKLAFPDHELEDDVLYLEARIHSKLMQYDQAEKAYLRVVEKYADGIRGDNAMYELAEMYDFILDRKEEAMKLYETLFIDYTSSVFATEARKRYRVLRGDFEL
jgi:tetratricopeptide (TPR) repeat protein